MPPISDLVRDSKLETTFHREYTQHVYFVSGDTPRQRKVRKEERWQREKYLGTGAFGTVWLEKFATGIGETQHRAVKEIRKSVQSSKASDYSRELEAIAKFSHPKYERCFVKSFGWYEDDANVYITMEYFPYGDLHQYLLVSPILEGEVQEIISQVLEGLSFMHDNGFAHRDLKPNNVLVKSRGPDWWVKIGDFGISKRAEEGVTALRTLNGTLGFLAPEMLAQLGFFIDSDFEISEEYTTAVDIWSLGEIAFRALTREPAFSIPSLRTYIKGTSSFPINVLHAHGVNNEGCDLLKSLMAPNPTDRLTAKEALHHKWIESPKPYSAMSTVEIQRSSPLTEDAAPFPGYSTTQTSARWSTLNDTILKLNSLENLRSAEESPVILQSVRNTASSSSINKCPEEILKLEEEARKAGAEASEESNYTPVYTLTQGSSCRTLEGHTGAVWAVAFSPDGRLVVSGSGDKTVRLWDPATGAVRRTLEGHTGVVWAMAFSPDGRLVASGSGDKTVRLWDPATGAVRRTLKGHAGMVWAVVFSPDGRLVASGSEDDTARLWDPATGAVRRTLEGHTGGVWAVAFSPDSRLVASGAGDKTVRLWNPATGVLHRTLEGHAGGVWAVTFSPDGRLVASGSGDDTVRLWDPATGAVRRTLEGHTNWVWAVAFSPDGRLVACGSEDDTVRLWDLVLKSTQATLGQLQCTGRFW